MSTSAVDRDQPLRDPSSRSGDHPTPGSASADAGASVPGAADRVATPGRPVVDPDGEAPVVFAVTDASDAVPEARRARLLHGPSGLPRRIVVAVITYLAVALAVPALALATGVAGPLVPSHAFAASIAWLLVALALGNGGRTSKRPGGVRPALLAGVLVVGGIGILKAIGMSLPDSRGMLGIVVVTAVVAATLRKIGSSVIRTRAVVIAAAGIAPPVTGVEQHALIQVRDPEAAEPGEIAAATVRAVDETQADVVRVPGTLSKESITEISWALRNQAVPVQIDLLDGTLHHSRVVGSADSDGVSVVLTPPLPGLRTRLLKRTMDVVGSSLLLLILSPVLLGTALAIWLDDRGPVLFRQTRIGKDGEPFRILKFRSMAVDADARLQELLRAQRSEDQPLFKVQDDPRLTRVGAFIRRYSIDEFPQLFNVLGGTMSLVGPRPQRDAEVALYSGTDSHRLGVTPGMTGLWQVSGRSNLSWDEARRLDVHYAHNWSMWLDISILLRTAKAVIGKDGAY